MIARQLLACWYARPAGDGCGLWAVVLAPLAGVFSVLSAARTVLYKVSLLRQTRLLVPVIVIGNITVGGTGKTPLAIWLAQTLRAAGLRPGIVSRGYGGVRGGARPVLIDSDPAQVGDEPLLLARQTGCPVWVGARRAEAGAALLAAHPEVDVVLCDDGLQHLALARDIEIVVVDGARGVGNGHHLPWGPLREGVGRLKTVTAVVVNGVLREALPLCVATYTLTLRPGVFRNVACPTQTRQVADFVSEPVYAVAGIGNPQRFFEQLTGLGLTIIPHAFPDHHRFNAADLPTGTVIMTTKDAVKCTHFAHSDCWALEVDAEVDEALKGDILNKLKEIHHG